LAFLFCTSGYFYHGSGFNQNSRFDLIRAIILERTFSIDQFHENTRDKAVYQGHYYSDKAPGIAFLGLIPFWASYKVLTLAGVREGSFAMKAGTEYLTTLFTIGLLSALLGVFVFRMAEKISENRRSSLWLAAAYGIATPVLAYSALFYSHQAAAALIFISFYCLFTAGNDPRQNHLLFFISGLLAGWAAISEYPAGLAVIGVGLYLIFCRRSMRGSVFFFLGMMFPLILCGYYHHACFGSPFVTAYAHK